MNRSRVGENETEAAVGPAKQSDALAERADDEQRFRLLVQSVTEYAIFMLDTEGRIASWNAGAERINGYTESEALGKHFSMLYPEDERDTGRPDSGLRQASVHGSHQEEGWRVRKDGSRFWAIVLITPMHDQEGRLVGYGEVARDLTSRREVEQELRHSHERYRALYEDNPTIYITSDADGHVTSANHFGAHYLGYSPEELVGTALVEIVHPDDRELFRKYQERCFRDPGTVVTVEFRKVKRDGTVIWVREAGRAVPAADGRLLVLNACEDITERMRLLESEKAARAVAERRAREETALRRAAGAVNSAFGVEEVVRQIAASALDASEADGAFVERVHSDGRCVRIVAVAGERVPPVGEEVPYRGSLAERVIEDRQAVLVGGADASEHGLPAHCTLHCGECSGVAVPLLDSGDAIGALVVLRTAERPGFEPEELERLSTFATLASLAFRKAHLLEEEEQRLEQLERVMESRTRLIRGFSHDVKNPLGAADGYLALLEDGLMGELSGKQLESIGRVRRAVHASLTLINDLVELARTEAGHVAVNLEPVDVWRAAREMADEYRAKAEAKGLALEVELPVGLCAIRSDDTRIRQVLGNLLSNAVKYTPEGGAIVVSAAARGVPGAPDDPGGVEVVVSDTGPGIPPEKREEIFQEFTRLEPGASDGAGLGLAISRRIARALGGDIRVGGGQETGSSFVLWLPEQQGVE